jgi:hypothetical protein
MDVAIKSAPTAATAEPVALLVTRWKCPFCQRSRSTRKAATEHIARCWYNPAARSCKTCALYERVSDGEWCDPSRPCDCNQGYEACGADVDLSVYGSSLPVGCPFWQLGPRKVA